MKKISRTNERTHDSLTDEKLIMAIEHIRKMRNISLDSLIPKDSLGQPLREGDIVIAPNGSYTTSRTLFGRVVGIKREMKTVYVNDHFEKKLSNRWRIYLKLYESVVNDPDRDNYKLYMHTGCFKENTNVFPSIMSDKEYFETYGYYVPEVREASNDDFKESSSIVDFEKIMHRNFNYSDKPMKRWRYNYSLIKINEGTSSLIMNTIDVLDMFDQQRIKNYKDGYTMAMNANSQMHAALNKK